MKALLADAIRVTPDQSFRLSFHPGHHRITHVTCKVDAIADFLHHARDIDVQNLEYVPFMRYHLADLLIKRLGRAFARTVVDLIKDRRHGGFIIGLQGLSQDTSDFVKFGTAVGHILGPSNHDAMSGTYYARFVVKHTDDSDSYLRQAYRLFTTHTDGTFANEARDWLLMMKFAEQNAIGGESRFLRLDDWEGCERLVNHTLGTGPFLSSPSIFLYRRTGRTTYERDSRCPCVRRFAWT